MTSSVPPAIRDMPEAALQKLVLELAAITGWRTAHFHDSRREIRRRSGERLVIGDKAAAGFPDVVLCRRGRLLFVELKSEKGRLSPTQIEWLRDLERVEADGAGRVIVRVWRPSDWDSGEIERVLIGVT